MKCPYCEHDNEDSKYCINCGKDLHKITGEGVEDILFVPKKKSLHTLRNILLIIGVLSVLSVLVLFIIGSENTSTTNNTSNNSSEGSNQITNSNRWELFNSVEHGFAVSFPKYPTTDRIPEEKVDGISYSGIQYISSPDNDTSYLVQVGNYDISPQDYDNKTGLEGVVNGMTKGSGGTLTDSAFTKFNGYDAINFVLTTKDGYFGKGISFIRDDLAKIKVFILLLFAKSDNFPDYNNFINSFRLN